MITKKAAILLRRSYVAIRFSDHQDQSSYKITVRQLESLIRLSEALARLECSLEVTEDHVREAVRLLSSSILKVHQPDLEIDNGGNLTQVKDDSHTGPMQEQANKMVVEA